MYTFKVHIFLSVFTIYVIEFIGGSIKIKKSFQDIRNFKPTYLSHAEKNLTTLIPNNFYCNINFLNKMPSFGNKLFLKETLRNCGKAAIFSDTLKKLMTAR